MRKRLSFSIYIMVCVVIVWLVVGSRKVNAVSVGEPAPNFSLIDALSGNTISLTNQKGKVVLLDFFATYCWHCQQAFVNDLVPLYNQSYRDDPYVVFLSINVWQPGITAEQLRSFARNYGVTWPILMGSPPSNISTVYGVECIPTLFIIDGDGMITFRYNCGSPGAEILKEEIDVQRLPLAIDTNGDGIVNLFDLYTVGVAFGTTPIDPKWNPSADISNDNIVNDTDLILVSDNFGKTV